MTVAQAKEAVEHYTEKAYDTVSVHADPRVSGTFAIRAQIMGKPRKKMVQDDFLIVGWRPSMSKELASHLLEECEFETWPPVSGALKWF